jgi:RNA-directed DNA polymerase
LRTVSCTTRQRALPQGGVISPCLSKILLHHVLDEWFEIEVKPRLRGECALARFADDALMAFDNIVDAKRVLAVLGKRLARYGLTLHPDKTSLVDFRPKRLLGACHPETDGTNFDFLGLTHVWGRSRNGKNMVRQVTAKGRFARAVAAVNDWCREHRHWSIHDQHRHLSSMMRGHFAYYGVGGNSRRLRWFADQVVRVWRKWLSRRDRQGVVTWTRFNELLARHHCLQSGSSKTTPPRANLSREEPDAGKLHVRVCEGWATSPPTRQFFFRSRAMRCVKARSSRNPAWSPKKANRPAV